MSVETPSPKPTADTDSANMTALARWLPGVWLVRHYRREWLVKDTTAGVVLTTLLVPAGLGYAQASGLPPVTGLYATILPLLVYALFGPSRVLVLGPDSALVPLVAAASVTNGNGDPRHTIARAAVLAILTGALCMGGSLLRAGSIVADLLSKPVRVGYLNGIAATILITQLPKLFGFSVHATDLLHGAMEVTHGVLAGRVHPIAFALGGGALAVMIALRALVPRVPGLFLVIVIATVVVRFAALDVPVVGAVPSGIPTPSFPVVALSELGELFTASLGIALVAYADTSVLSRTFARRQQYQTDPNRELVALGAANVAAGFFGGFPVSSSASRTPVAVAAGSRTQLTGVVGAIMIAIVLLTAPRLLATLPLAALAAVVIDAATRMFDVATMRVSWRVRRSDFVLSLVAFASVALLGVLKGIAIAVAVSLLDVVRRAWRPHDAILGRAPGVKGYHDVTRYPNAKQVPGLVLLRWDAPIFFANADTFRDRVLAAAREREAKWIVIAAEPITDVDTTAAEMLEELDADLTARGVELAFAEMKDPVKDRLHRYGLEKRIGREFFFPTIGVAVKAYVKKHDVEWVDWENAPRE